MNLVITMAGLGSRFKEAGYNVPKYMIEAHEKSLFHWSMLSLSDFFAEDRFIFIVRKEDNASEFIGKECKKIGIRNYYIIEIDYTTDGQATTALLAEKYWKADQALLIYNIDTYVEEGQMLKSDIRGDGFIPCFIGQGDHWSFVKIDNKDGRALEVREKKRISENCTLGAYYFKSCNLYKDIYTEYYVDKTNIEKNEKYVAPLYNLMISKNHDIYISIIDKDKIHVLGTPKELQAFKQYDPISSD